MIEVEHGFLHDGPKRYQQEVPTKPKPLLFGWYDDFVQSNNPFFKPSQRTYRLYKYLVCIMKPQGHKIH